LAVNARELVALIAAGDETIPSLVCTALMPLVHQLERLDVENARIDYTIVALAKADPIARRPTSISGIGPVCASAIAASVQDIAGFSGPRESAAWFGLTPRQNSSGGKELLARVPTMGNRYLRKLLVVGADVVHPLIMPWPLNMMSVINSMAIVSTSLAEIF
jgi:transposase